VQRPHAAALMRVACDRSYAGHLNGRRTRVVPLPLAASACASRIVVQGDRSPTGCEVARNTFRDDAANPRQRGSVTAQWHLTGECSCEAYDADERVINPLAAAGKRAVIPPKANRRSPREVDRHLYKARHLIENFFAKLKQFRASRHATIRPHATSWPPSTSPPSPFCSIDDTP
jgi:hypothetical protein